MDETVELALKHQRELHDKLEKDMLAKFAGVEAKLAKIDKEIKTELTWKRIYITVGVMMGLVLSAIPGALPFLKFLK